MPSSFHSRRTHLGLLSALGLVTFFQARIMLQSSSGQAPAASRIGQDMQARVNGISTALTSYLQNHDPESLQRIKTEGSEASRLLGELKEEMIHDGNATAYARIEKAHEDIRGATLSLLAADQAVVKGRQDVNEATTALMTVLGKLIEPSIKPSQLNSSTRLRAIHAAVSEVQNVTPGDGLDPARARFRKAMITYEELSRTRRAAHWADQANGLFDQCMTRMRDLQSAEDQKRAALDHYTRLRNTADHVLTENNPTTVSLLTPQFFKKAYSSGLAHVGLVWVLLFVGMILTFATGRRAEKQLTAPLQDILQCVEAAATGDMSRIPQHWSRDEVGQLSQAVGRLITVLARSENLVYHLAALVESSGEAIISHTLDGTILSWNKGAQRIYGYSAEEVKGRSITMLTPVDGESELMRMLQRIQRGERVQPFETLHQARNGRMVRALVRVSAILDSTRKVIGASFCAQDLTDTGLLQQKSIEGRQIA